jgi:hypothetical protein
MIEVNWRGSFGWNRGYLLDIHLRYGQLAAILQTWEILDLGLAVLSSVLLI